MHRFQFCLIFSLDMSSFFKVKIVFALLVLCAFNFSTIESIKWFPFPKPSSTSNLPRPLPVRPVPPVPSRNLNSMRTTSSSMESINLGGSTSTSSNVYRSLSSGSLNTARTGSIMREMSHQAAARALNPGAAINDQQSRTNTLMQMLRPNKERLRQFGVLSKNTAIGIGAVGGVFSISHSYSTNNENQKNSRENGENSEIYNSSTIRSELYNPIGKEK